MSLLLNIVGNFIGLYGRFPALLLFLYAGYCKNKIDSEDIHPIPQQEQGKARSNFLKEVSKNNKIDFEQHNQISKNHVTPVEDSDLDEITKDYSDQKNGKEEKEEKKEKEEKETIDAKPSFTLKDITIQLGTTQSMILEATGNTTGYCIKSTSVKKNERYYTGKFGIDGRKTFDIPPSGQFFISLTADPKLKTGSYTLQITIGKKGKGSDTTKQLLSATINVIEEGSKKEQQNESSDIQQTTEPTEPLDINIKATPKSRGEETAGITKTSTKSAASRMRKKKSKK